MKRGVQRRENSVDTVVGICTALPPPSFLRPMQNLRKLLQEVNIKGVIGVVCRMAAKFPPGKSSSSLLSRHGGRLGKTDLTSFVGSQSSWKIAHNNTSHKGLVMVAEEKSDATGLQNRLTLLPMINITNKAKFKNLLFPVYLQSECWRKKNGPWVDSKGTCTASPRGFQYPRVSMFS